MKNILMIIKKTLIVLALPLIVLSGCRQKNNEAVEQTPATFTEKLPTVEEGLNNLLPIKEYQLPKGVTYNGAFKDGIRYFDKSGEHVALITENTYVSSIDGEGLDNAELFAYHFDVNESNNVTQTWKVHDFEKECPVDVIAEFLDNTFQVTDLDDNGIAEIWLAYIQGCKGDVSPWSMKIIMYQGQQKYAMRGVQKIVYMVDDGIHEYGGEYTFDNAFNNAPKVFRDFAEKLWESNCEDRLGEYLILPF